MTLLANSPSLDELRVEPSAESRSVALQFVVSGHMTNGTRRGGDRLCAAAVFTHGPAPVASDDPSPRAAARRAPDERRLLVHAARVPTLMVPQPLAVDLPSEHECEESADEDECDPSSGLEKFRACGGDEFVDTHDDGDVDGDDGTEDRCSKRPVFAFALA